MSPLAELVRMRNIFTILAGMRDSNFAICTENHELCELGRVAESLHNGTEDYVQEFSSIISAAGTVERQALERMSQLWTSDVLWSPIPPESCTVKFRASCFRSVSKLGCCIRELMIQRMQCPDEQIHRCLDPHFDNEHSSGCVLAYFGKAELLRISFAVTQLQTVRYLGES